MQVSMLLVSAYSGLLETLFVAALDPQGASLLDGGGGASRRMQSAFKIVARFDWNNSGTANPATGVGGISSGVAGPYYASASSSSASTSYTANFGASAFSFTMPSGFTSWNGLV